MWERVARRVSRRILRFEELQELCAAGGDKASLAIGMAGMVASQMLYARVEEASRLASAYMELLEEIRDPTLTVGLSVVAIFAKLRGGPVGRRASLGTDSY